MHIMQHFGYFIVIPDEKQWSLQGKLMRTRPRICDYIEAMRNDTSSVNRCPVHHFIAMILLLIVWCAPWNLAYLHDVARKHVRPHLPCKGFSSKHPRSTLSSTGHLLHFNGLISSRIKTIKKCGAIGLPRLRPSRPRCSSTVSIWAVWTSLSKLCSHLGRKSCEKWIISRVREKKTCFSQFKDDLKLSLIQ